MIGPIDGTPIRPERAAGETKKAAPAPQPAPEARRVDRVEISARGRELAGQSMEVAGLDPERVAEIRRNIAEGRYHTPEIAEAVASRMLERGDV